ncbi:hypothetical protein HCUR_01009 [Holospora curviuscula]|uniref:Uncharacterized protein n=1 Tax=Holospora curviuscula TaxID=1082868 RepID=A0A2S5R895_9PROT|nr:hypothetical protein HCUR_01009 [Holospora curviuscula]
MDRKYRMNTLGKEEVSKPKARLGRKKTINLNQLKMYFESKT